MNYTDLFWHTFNNSRESSNELREDSWIKHRAIVVPSVPFDLEEPIIVTGELYAH